MSLFSAEAEFLKRSRCKFGKQVGTVMYPKLYGSVANLVLIVVSLIIYLIVTSNICNILSPVGEEEKARWPYLCQAK